MARGRVTNAETVPQRSELFTLPWILILWLFSYEPAAPSRGVQQSCTQKKQKNGAHLFKRAMAKPLLHFFNTCIYNPLRNACKGIASHSHQEITAVFIIGNIQGFISEAKTYLHNFPTARRVTDFQIS